MNIRKILDSLQSNKWPYLALLLTSIWYGFIAFSNGVSFFAPDPKGSPSNDEIYPELQHVFPHYGYYNLLAESLSNGQTWLNIEPNPKLLTLADPYDATANQTLRVQDLSLYNGKYFLYFGITPCILLFLPTLLLGYPISQAAAVFLLCLLTLWILGLWLIRQDCPTITKVLGILFIATSTCLPVLLRRPSIYEVSIASGALFGVLCVLGIYYAISRSSVPLLALAGIAFALAVGSRPTLIVLAPLLVAGGIVLINNRKHWTSVLVSSIPAIIIGIGLISYNWVRFENPLEFGMTYQLSTHTITKDASFKVANVPPIINSYLWSQPQITGLFPYVQPSYLNTKLPEPFYIREPVIGLLYLSPIFFLAIIPIITRNLLGILAFSAGVLILAFTAFSFPAIHFRYMADFGALLTLAGLCGLVYLTRPIFSLCLLPSVFITVLYSFVGTHNLLMRSHPAAFVILDKYTPSFINYHQPKIINTINQNGWKQLGDKPFYIRLYSPTEATFRVNPSKGNSLKNSEFHLKTGVNWIKLYGRGNLNKATLETDDWKVEL